MPHVKDFAIGDSLWTADTPDFRDKSIFDDKYADFLAVKPDNFVDLSDGFLPPEKNCKAYTSAAISIGGLIEYLNFRLGGESGYVSKGFISEISCRFGQNTSLRNSLKVIARFGVPPQKFVREKPLASDPFLFGFRDEYRDLEIIRVDCADQRSKSLSTTIKKLLTNNLPCVFGFPVMSSITWKAKIDFSPELDEVTGSTTGILVGFDDNRETPNRGAFKFRSTWGPDWGEGGFGWLDYEYLKRGLVRDIWTVSKPNLQAGPSTEH